MEKRRESAQHKEKIHKKGVYQCLGATLKCWLTPKMLVDSWENVMLKHQKRPFQPANGMQSTHLLVEIHNIHPYGFTKVINKLVFCESCFFSQI